MKLRSLLRAPASSSRTLVFVDETSVYSIAVEGASGLVRRADEYRRCPGASFVDAVREWIGWAQERGILGREAVFTLGMSAHPAVIGRYAAPRSSPEASISPGEEKDLLELARELMQDHAKRRLLAEKGILPEDWRLLRTVVGDAEIDGYAVPHLRGYRGSSVELGVLGVFLLQRHAEALVAECTRKGVAVSAVHVAEGIARLPRAGGLYVEVAAEHSRIILVRRGKIALTAGIPAGYNLLIRRIASKLGIEERAAMDLLVARERGTSPEESSRSLHDIILPEAEHFATLCVSAAGTGNRVTEPIRLLGPHSSTQEFLEAFSRRGSASVMAPEEAIPSWGAARLSPSFTPLALVFRALMHDRPRY